MAKTIKFGSGSATKTLEELKANQVKLQEALKEAAIEALKEFCTGIFDKHPEVEQFAWVQYGGEYNDEGPYHGVNQVAINDENVEEAIYDWGRGGVSEEINKGLSEIFGDNVLLSAFDTDVSSCDLVTVTRDGITVEYWDRW